MRIIKIIAWICVLFLLQTTFGSVIGINGACPELLLAFSVIFAFFEQDMGVNAYVIIICALLSGSSAGGVFAVEVLAVGAASIISRAAAQRLRFIAGFARALFAVAVGVTAMETANFFVIRGGIDAAAVAVPIIYTVACAAVMYPIMSKTLFPKENKKLLIV